jgi:Mg/Co/Ni transporter MgtE
MKNETEDEYLEIKDEGIDLDWINQLKIEMHDSVFENMKKNRKACGLLIPLVSHDDIIELLAELHELRAEKEMKKIEEEAKKKA